MNEWISVNDKLPKYLEDVLVYDGDYFIGHLCRDEHGNYFTDGWDKLQATHWMPLPPIPNETEANKE